MKEDHPVLYFDGDCLLCNRAVTWIIDQDPEAVYRFASLQSEEGQALLEAHQLPQKSFDSFLLSQGNQLLDQSDAFLELVARLPGGVRHLRFFKLVPAPIRNAVYRFIARNRYRWFGKKDSCAVPNPDIQKRML